MTEKTKDKPDVLKYKIPRIELYEVTADELNRTEETAGQVGQDFTFMLASFSACISLVVALATGDFSENRELTFKAAAGILVLSGIYTGWRWYRGRSNFKKVIDRIRSRKVDPEV